MGASLGIWTSRPWSKCSNSRSHGREPRAGSAALANVLANEFWVVDCMRQFMAQKHRKPQLPCTCLAVAQQNSGAKGIKKKMVVENIETSSVHRSPPGSASAEFSHPAKTESDQIQGQVVKREHQQQVVYECSTVYPLVIQFLATKKCLDVFHKS